VRSGALRAAVIGRQGQVATVLRLRLPVAGIKVIALARPEIVRAENDLDTAFALTVIGAGAVATAAIGCPSIHLPTVDVFDGTRTVPDVESDDLAPLGIYGASKLAGERAVAAGQRPTHHPEKGLAVQPLGAELRQGDAAARRRAVGGARG